ncbi:hypothetical protein [Kitasatospora sp. NPDC051914]|uniref:hypothetical protein n=1 Tax=Kitasatospora sp. NPDC051914 TaxID=3154945 RepID=UPI00341DB673
MRGRRLRRPWSAPGRGPPRRQHRCDAEDGRYTLALLTPSGWGKVVATALGHVAEVRRLVFDPLTRAQQRRLRDIGRRVTTAVDPDGSCPGSAPA